uniref:Uncharacterized protein n=1 Tax=Strigamia maritima TaxID=126957 RepID=T1IHT7_STRMM
MRHYLFIFTLNYFIISTSLDPQPIIIPGSINIAFLLDIHSNNPENKLCSQINPNAVEQVLTALWTAQVINSENDSTSKFGFTIYDTCGESDIATRQVFEILRTFHKEGNQTDDININPPLLGVIGVGENTVLSSVTSLLSAFSIPFVIASPGGRDLDLKAHNILVTSPGLMSQVKPLASLLKTFQWKLVRVISSSSSALNEFIQVIKTADIVMTQSLLVVDGFIDLAGVQRILQKTMEEQIIVIVLLSPAELEKLSQILLSLPLNDAMWIIASPALDRSDLKQIGPAFGSGIFIETHSTNSEKFKSYVFDIITNGTNLTNIENLISKYAENKFNCSWDIEKNNMCKTLPQKSFQAYHEHSAASHVAEAVSALASAYQIMRIDRCQDNAQCADPDPLGPKMLDAMKKLGFSFHKNLQPEYEGVQFRFTGSGKLIKTHSHVILYNKSEDPILIGWYSEDLGISLNSFAASFARNQFQTTEYHHVKNHTKWPKLMTYNSDTTYTNHIERISHNASVRRPWAAATLILAGLGILGTMYTLVYIVLRTYDGTLTGNQTFTILLLLSVTLLYCTCITYVFPPNELMCVLRLILHPTAHMFCYSLLLVQAMMYKSLSTLGLGGTLNFTHL